MKSLLILLTVLTVVTLLTVETVLTGVINPPFCGQNYPAVDVTNLLGENTRIRDANRDGFDDFWCMIYPQIKHRDKHTDTDDDGTSDYDEMLLWRNPITKWPTPDADIAAEA